MDRGAFLPLDFLLGLDPFPLPFLLESLALDFVLLPCGLIPLGILSFRLNWTRALGCIVASRVTDSTSAWLSPWMIPWTIVTFSLNWDFPFTGIDVLIIHGVLDSAAGACHNLGNLVLLLMQLQFNEEFCKHSVDPIQRYVGLTQLMLCI